jgi:ferredoxin
MTRSAPKGISLEAAHVSSMTAKVTVDEKECTGCGLCYEDECPTVFAEGKDGISMLQAKFQKGGSQVGEIPDDQVKCAKQAEDACPVSAIKVG